MGGGIRRNREKETDKEEEQNPKYCRWSMLCDDSTFLMATYSTYRSWRTALMWLQFLSAVVCCVNSFYFHCCSLIFQISVAAPLVATLIANSKFPIDISSSKNHIRYLYHYHHHPLEGHAVAQSVEALRYKPEGHGFDSRRCHWNFSMT